jgi:hypothetical protein
VLLRAGEYDRGATGKVYVSGDERSAGLVAAGLPEAGSGVYQLWAISDGSPRPLESFTREATGTAMVLMDLGPTTRLPSFAVTLETRSANPVLRGPMVLRPVEAS